MPTVRCVLDHAQDSARVVIVDDHELLAETLRLALSAEGYDVVCSGVDREAVATAMATQPDVVLLDLNLGDAGGDGRDMLDLMVAENSRVVMLTGSTDRPAIASCLEAGASGYISKSAPFVDLLGVVRAAASGGEVLSDPDRQDLLTELSQARRARRRELGSLTTLTDREQFVLAQVMEGKSATEIAADSFVSEATIRTQIRGVLLKLGVQSQLAAVAVARRAGWERAAS